MGIGLSASSKTLTSQRLYGVMRWTKYRKNFGLMANQMVQNKEPWAVLNSASQFKNHNPIENWLNSTTSFATPKCQQCVNKSILFKKKDVIYFLFLCTD